jgi:MYXO-CTERM domain-containing protein
MGDCLGGDPVVCVPDHDCHGEGTCHPDTGCLYPAANEGGACDDGDACTMNDTCQSGDCLGEGDPCAPDASPDSAMGPNLDSGAVVAPDGTPPLEVDAGEPDGGQTQEALNPEPERVSLYACTVTPGGRPLTWPFFLGALALVLVLAIRRRRLR